MKRSATAFARGARTGVRMMRRSGCPKRRKTSRDLLILVDEPAEAVVSLDLVDLGCWATGEWSCGSV
jgi:hypothetical protein